MDFSLVGGSHPLSSCPFVAQSVWRYFSSMVKYLGLEINDESESNYLGLRVFIIIF